MNKSQDYEQKVTHADSAMCFESNETYAAATDLDPDAIRPVLLIFYNRLEFRGETILYGRIEKMQQRKRGITLYLTDGQKYHIALSERDIKNACLVLSHYLRDYR
jgi:hypothetical protein